MHICIDARARRQTGTRTQLTLPELSSNLNKLTINPTASRQQAPVADSWEDEDSEEDDDTETPVSHQHPSAPPPTPISPSHASSADTFVSPFGYRPDAGSDVRSERMGARSDKTDAVAKRLIAGALGVRAPKKTEEQKAYDAALREKELKRRREEKEAQAKAVEEAEKAKRAIWED
jgi:hypothetical protein